MTEAVEIIRVMVRYVDGPLDAGWFVDWEYTTPRQAFKAQVIEGVLAVNIDRRNLTVPVERLVYLRTEVIEEAAQ